MRIAACVEYEGNRYYGWQLQPDLNTVQKCVEAAFSTVSNHDVRVHCAGRTDTCVHAMQQIIHFDTEVNRSEHAWVYGANANLPKDIRICWAKQISDDFHARYSATARGYRYLIYNSPIRPALFYDALTWQYRPLDHERMQRAANFLIGEHDFTTFRALDCSAKTPVRTIHELQVTRLDDFVIIDVKANAFLHHMVRNIAGVLMTVGSGNQDVEWVEGLLQAKNRSLAAETAPPYGLYLMNVEYPSEFNLPRRRNEIPILKFQQTSSKEKSI